MKKQVNEIKRMQQLAGLIKEKYDNNDWNDNNDWDDDIVGKRGIDYNNDQGTIIAAAQAKNYKSLIKYDPSGLLSSDSVDGSIDPLALIVAFKSDKGDVGVYPLGDNGVRVIKAKYQESTMNENSILSDEAYNRIDGLVNQKDMDMLRNGGRNIVSDLTDDGFEDEEIIEYICKYLKNFL